jgi:hypothetical protein
MSISGRNYVVVVCPKCRIQAQIVEDTGQKTIRCQNCGVTLRFRKLRQFSCSPDLQEAIIERTKLQALIAGKGVTVPDVEIGESQIQKRVPGDMRLNKPVEIILSNIRQGETVSCTELKNRVVSMDMDIFEMTLRRLLESGDIYEPKTEFYRRV